MSSLVWVLVADRVPAAAAARMRGVERAACEAAERRWGVRASLLATEPALQAAAALAHRLDECIVAMRALRERLKDSRQLREQHWASHLRRVARWRYRCERCGLADHPGGEVCVNGCGLRKAAACVRCTRQVRTRWVYDICEACRCNE
jgi:hypothetical protein